MFIFAFDQNQIMRLFVIVLFSLSFSSCQESAVSKINTSKQTQVRLDDIDRVTDVQMNFNATEWDFGSITQGDVVEYSFEFINSGADPLIISDAKGSCGCTVPEWPKAPISSGEKGTINVKFDSKGKKGNQNKRVTLITNMVPSHKVLIVKGQVNLKEE